MVVLQSIYLILLLHHLFNTLSLISYITVNKNKLARNTLSKFMKLLSYCYFTFFFFFFSSPLHFFFFSFAQGFTCLSNSLSSNFLNFRNLSAHNNWKNSPIISSSEGKISWNTTAKRNPWVKEETCSK